MKQRITGLDLQVLTSEFNKELLSYRLQNIYNVASNSRQYLLKFSIPDSKKTLVLEYGNRIHLTDFERPTTQQPTNFVTKLRKHLKTRRLSGIKQIQNDRILVLQFSDGLYYLVFEFFSAGNILLLDENFNILSLQRLVSAKDDIARYAVNEKYRLFDKSLFDRDYNYEKKHYTSELIKSWLNHHKEKYLNQDNKKAKVFSIHKLVFLNANHLASDLILKVFTEEEIVSSESCLNLENNESLISKVVDALNKCEERYIELISSDSICKGYIVAKKNMSEDSEFEYIFDEYHPFEPIKLNENEIIDINGYNKTLDKFYSTTESNKFALKIEQQKDTASKRLKKAKSERDKQIQSLLHQQEVNAKKGELIQYHSNLVDDCRAYIQGFLDQQMDWTNIESVIKLEQRKRNEVAQAIDLPLNLKENKITLLLPDFDDYDQDSSESANSTASETESSDEDNSDDDLPINKRKDDFKKEKISNVIPTLVDITLTSFANARSYFDAKKVAESKQVKVENSTQMALKNAERKINQDLAKNLKESNDTLKEMRPKYWFEKFYWFVSSEGYLCLAGRDNSQNDMLYYRHFGDNDFFVSSDVEGSLKVFIKNPFKDEGVPPSTLMQAGIFSMSASNAWNSKITTSAWVLPGTEISKRDYDGSLVPSGQFNYIGKKEYLPPAQLVMGFGFYCLIDEESAKLKEEQRITREKEHGLTIVVDNKKKELENITITNIKEESKTLNNETENDDSKSKDEETSQEATKSNAPLPRGKRSKMKKIAAKYAFQDEEERKLRMHALGTLKQVEDKDKQKQNELSQKGEAIKKIKEKELLAERKKKQEEREFQNYLMNNDSEDNNEATTTNYLQILDSFTSKPSTEDKIINLVPVFAPWASLQKFKYKVKIQPGGGKKGKCITDALQYFSSRKMDNSSTDTDLDWPVERELISNIKSTDLIGVFPVTAEMVSITKILSSGLIFATQDQFRDVNSPELAAKEQYNIVKYLAAAGPYIQHPGFGVSTDIPDECTINSVQYYGRHGERFPGLSAGLKHKQIVDKLQRYNNTFKGELAFLNDYQYYVPNEDLYEYETTPANSIGPYTGYETAIKAGAAFRSKYGQLYNDSEILPLFYSASARVEETALNFATAFIGEKYSDDKIRKVIVSENATSGLNSATPRWGCPSWNSSAYGNYTSKFPTTYLNKTVTRFTNENPGLNITTDDVSNLFQICAYELNSRGYSPFCNIFTQDEFVTYGYQEDLNSYYSSGPGNVNSSLAGAVQLNATLQLLKDTTSDNKIWLTFSHDTDMELFTSALGLFDTINPLPNDKIRFTDTYHHVEVTPMGGRVVTEKLQCSNETYVRFIINDAVIPIANISDGPGFSTKLTDFETYVNDRIGKYKIPRDCQTPSNLSQALTFYWDYKNGGYNGTVPRQTA
ncbi:unnamed protein product [Candida verbasci]|uniref:Ribosome quality control complex subunit 2 n=1 Tax=Candida verbasci TaxID=1227364 RepID=A0A9W4TTJ4_9ASCO|nr:unnamed protein product [Candida verbasci]